MSNWMLELGSAFDWISPVVATVQDIVNGPSHTFQIPRECGWSGAELERMLKEHGIKTWGVMIPAFSDTLLVTVRKAQVRWAAYLLERHGIPVDGRLPAGAGHSMPRAGAPSAAQGARTSGSDWIDRLSEMLWS